MMKDITLFVRRETVVIGGGSDEDFYTDSRDAFDGDTYAFARFDIEGC